MNTELNIKYYNSYKDIEWHNIILRENIVGINAYIVHKNSLFQTVIEKSIEFSDLSESVKSKKYYLL